MVLFMENPIKMDHLGGNTPILETPTSRRSFWLDEISPYPSSAENSPETRRMIMDDHAQQGGPTSYFSRGWETSHL